MGIARKSLMSPQYVKQSLENVTVSSGISREGSGVVGVVGACDTGDGGSELDDDDDGGDKKL